MMYLIGYVLIHGITVGEIMVSLKLKEVLMNVVLKNVLLLVTLKLNDYFYKYYNSYYLFL